MADNFKSLSQQTEQKLANIFMQISIHESETEKFRYSLSKNPDFDPYLAFKALDRLDLNSLSGSEFQSFLEKFHFFCTADEAYLLIRQYDSNLNGRLCFKEFLNLILPCTNKGLKELAMSRQGKFTEEVEFLLSKLIGQEIWFHRDLEGLKRDIILRQDFNLVSAFRMLDERGGGIDRNGMLRFLGRYFRVFDYDVDAIFRRIDNDADGVVGYNEFVDCVMPTRVTVDIQYPSVINPEPKHSHYSSPLRNPAKSFQGRSSTPSYNHYSKSTSNLNPSNLSKLQNSSLASSQSKSVRFKEPFSSSSSNIQAYPHLSEAKNTDLYSTGNFNHSNKNSSPLRQSQKKLNSALKDSIPTINPRQRTSRPAALIQIIPVFQDYIKFMRQIEAVKNTLALRHDFNLNSAFSMFDQYNVGIISVNDLQSTLSSHSFQASTEDLLLLAKRSSHLQDNRLRFSDFSELFTPRIEEYSRILKSRGLKESLNNSIPLPSQETMNIFLKAFHLLIESEQVFEKHRQKLALSSEFDLISTFNALDKDRNGFISQLEFSEALSVFNVPFNCKDLFALVEKFDKNCDGRISYSEFVEELTPKAGVKY